MNDFSVKPKHIYIIFFVTLILSIIIFNMDSLTCGIESDTSVFNDFGTFYGGIFGTIVAFFALYFIFRTYDIQEKQYDIVKKDADFNIINRLYDNLLQEISSIEFRKKNSSEVFHGIDALFNYESDNPNAVLNHLQSILISFEHALLMADEKIKYKYDDQKKITLTRIYFLYYEKIIWPVYEKIYRTEKLKLKEQNHPGINELLAKYEDLTKRAYEFLLKEKYVGRPSQQEILDLLPK